jgi:hypothetical protein
MDRLFDSLPPVVEAFKAKERLAEALMWAEKAILKPATI